MPSMIMALQNNLCAVLLHHLSPMNCYVIHENAPFVLAFKQFTFCFPLIIDIIPNILWNYYNCLKVKTLDYEESFISDLRTP